MVILERLGIFVPRELLLQKLDDPIAHMRVMAIQLLQAIEYEESFPVDMIRLMIQDGDVRVREAAILALNQLDPIEPADQDELWNDQKGHGLKRKALRLGSD